MERSIVKGVGRKIAEASKEVDIIVEELDDIAFVVIWLPIRIETCIIGEGAIGRVVTLGMSNTQIVGEEEVAMLVRERDASVETVARRLLHDTSHAVVLQVDGIAEACIATLKAERVALAYACAQGLGHPVGIHASHDIL